MVNRLKQYFWIGLAIAAFYFLLSHHIIVTSYKDFDLLKKKELTLEYTFYNIGNKHLEEIMRVDMLRDAGIGDVLLKRGRVTEERLNMVLRKFDNN